MTFDPDVVALFEAMRLADLPVMADLSPPEARAFHKAQAQRNGGAIVDMAAVRDLAAEGPGGPIPLRLYRPHGAPERDAPTLVYYHGGGWVIGDLDTHDRVCRRIAAAAGCLVVAVDYRLAPEHPGPAASHDAIAALNWIMWHAGEIGADPVRLAVGGDSAGGNLAAVAAIAARDEGLPLRAQILVYPATDLRGGPGPYRSRLDNAEVKPLTADTMDYFIRHYLPDRRLADDPLVSPILASDLADLPPALVVTAERDVLRDEGVAYADRLAAAGVAVERLEVPGMIHGFITMGGVIGAADRGVAAIAATLRRAFAPVGPQLT